MTAAPGWYPDPSGIPNAFRWWDGGTWTTAISASAHAPDPINAQPAGGPAVDAGQGTGASQPAGGISGTSESHPGPDFEPAPWSRIETQPQAYAPIPAVASTGMKPWKIAVLFASVLAVVLVAGGIYLALRKGSEPAPPTVAPQPTQPQFTPTPQPTPTQPTENPSPSTPPSQTPPSSQTPQPSQTPQANQAHLVYTAPGGAWLLSAAPPLPGTLAGSFPQYAAYAKVTQSNYNGTGSSWVAMMDSLIPAPEWGVQTNQKTGLATMSKWYQASSFGGAALTSTTIMDKKVTVDGKSGWMLQQHYSYSIPGLESKGETGTFISVATGKNAAAVFLGSVPDTDKELQADVDAAIRTLKVMK